MKIIDRYFNEVLLIEFDVYSDQRGHFYESYQQEKFEKLLGKEVKFVQDNHSVSKRGVLRGLHAQRAPFEQAKLISVTSGHIFDVIVDIRPQSPTYLQWKSVELRGETPQALWIPEGFCHGFYSLCDNSQVTYKTTSFYAPQHELTLPWDDPILNIHWPLTGAPILSIKDAQALCIGMQQI